MEKEDNTLEFKLRDETNPWPKTKEELDEYIASLKLTEDNHTYGSCVYAMSLAAVAAYNFVASALGVTGFQAGYAKMDILKRLGSYKRGFRVIDYDKLMFPQYCDKEHFPSVDDLMLEPSIRKQLRSDAQAKLDEEIEFVHEDVMSHWVMLSKLPVLDKDAEDKVTLFDD